MKILARVSQILFVICLPVFLLTLSLSAAANCPLLYKYDFSRYNISEVTGIAPAELDKAAHEIIRYWNSGDKEINITVIKDGQPFQLFNEREVSHMVDVKALFRLAYKFLLGTFIYSLVFLGLALFLWKDKKLLAVGLMWGSGLSIFIMIALAIPAIVDFNWFFTQFHLLSFANDLWLLNPATDYLIMLFPEGFWSDAAIICAAIMVILALILGFIGWWMLKPGASKIASA